MLRRASLLLVAVGCGGASPGGPGVKAPAAAAVDIAPVRDDLSVYGDGKGHYVALVEPDPEKHPPEDLTLFWGDGKTFHAAKLANAHADGLKFEIGFQDNRVPMHPAGSIKRERGKVKVECWGGDADLKLVAPEQAKTMLASATFDRTPSDWAPLALGKDGDKYLFIDRGQTAETHSTYRVFEGAKGGLKKIDVTDAKWDERNDILHIKTAAGNLTASRDDSEKSEFTLKPAWEGKKGDYSALPRAKNWKLIFTELGVYPGKPPSTPCDPMLE